MLKKDPRTFYSRRQFIRYASTSTACAALGLHANKATALDPLAMILLPILGQVLGDLFKSRDEHEFQARVIASQMQQEYALRLFDSGKGYFSVAAHQGALQTLGVLSRNFDGHGSSIGIYNGQLGVERGGLQGVYLPSEIQSITPFVAQGEPMPVPVGPPTYPPATNETARRIEENLASSFSEGDYDQFRKNFAPMGVRAFSSARNPRSSSRADLTSVLAVSNQKIRTSGVVGRLAETVLTTST